MEDDDVLPEIIQDPPAPAGEVPAPDGASEPSAPLPRKGILSDEKVAELKAFSPREERQVKKTREQARLRKQQQREREKANALKDSEAEQWAYNRSRLKPEVLEAMKAQDQRVLDLLAGMTLVGDDFDHHDCSVEYVTKEVVDFVNEHGVTRLGAIYKDPDIPADWGGDYWRSAEMMEKLKGEGWQTEQRALYGLLAGPPDYRVTDFLHKKAAWQWKRAANFVGIYLTSSNVARYR
jgi:hypothetical protein